MTALRLPASTTDGIARFLDHEGNPSVWAVSDANLIAEGAAAGSLLDGLPGGCTHLVVWSGTLADGLFAGDNPLTWIGPGRAALDGAVAALAPLLRDRGVRLLLRPHCRHVLGDATTARSFLESLDPGAPVGLALDICSIFEPGMLRAAGDHCRRTFEILGPVAELVICTGAAAEADRVVPAPLGEGGPLDPALLGALIGEHCRPGTPVALLGERFGAQAALLGSAVA